MKDTQRFQMVAWISLLCTLTASAQDGWTLQNPEISPPLRANNAMASIGSDKVIIFGGFDESFNFDDQTWIYDLSDDNWTNPAPDPKPEARTDHAMAYIGDDHVLLYGGSGANNDTWLYDLSDNAWTLKSPVSNPSSRAYHTMAWVGGDKVILFGGANLNPDQTWVYDLSDDSWSLQNPNTVPVGRFGHAMANIGEDKVMMFTGQTVGDETWIYDLSDDDWTMQTPAAAPSVRSYYGLASVGGDQVVLFGGLDFLNGPPLGDTWIYDLSNDTWTLLDPDPRPSDRYTFAMASVGNGAAILLGFDLVNFTNETWLYEFSEETCSNPSVSAGEDAHLYFGYSQGQCITKTASVTGGTGPYTYQWTLDRDLLLDVINSSGDETMTGASSATVTVCLLDTAVLCVTVTDANGCTATDCAMMFAEDVRCFSGNNQKINVCHNGNTICIDENALDAHLNHGDYVGVCNALSTPQTGHHQFDIDIHQPEFTMSPNPNSGDFRIILDKSNTGIINILDIGGQLVRRIVIHEQSECEILSLATGIYFIQIVTGQQIGVKKLTVMQ